mmetsp:Transcript_20285/g.58238  ORF Transcript_20285/g.58238 Transcript_20285/m.58238 type:complete len:173 (-) Transcript_20285:1692-2210(-)
MASAAAAGDGGGPPAPAPRRSPKKGRGEPAMICANCGEAATAICTACKSVRYCNKECQLAHRKTHKAECKRREQNLKAAARSGRVKKHKDAPSDNLLEAALAGRRQTPTPSKPKPKVDNSVDAHIRRRFKELRKQGVPTKEAMHQARREYGHDQEKEKPIDPSKQVAAMFGL